MSSRLTDADYQLRWPRWLFKQEASRLLNRRELRDWDDRCIMLLEDAFVSGLGGGPVADFEEVSAEPEPFPWRRAPGQLSAEHRFLQQLLQSADQLKEDSSHRKPYWSQRKNGAAVQPARQAAVARNFAALVEELESRGYFENRFEKDCVDNPATVDPSAIIEHEIGVPDLWPLSADDLGKDLDLLCDVIEVMHELVSRPTWRRPHPFNGCGWHHGQFSLESGRAIYRWRVNQLLSRSDLGMRLADEGEDQGRMVAIVDDARSELVGAMVERTDEVGDQVRHAVAMFRARDADKHDKRSAIVTLCHLIEERRALLQSNLASKDEGALFEIANKFNLRHQGRTQQADYDPVFLDWLFWWYLATIELTDRLMARETVPGPD